MSEPSSAIANPWTAVWRQPRATIKHIIDTEAEKNVVALAALSGIASSLVNAADRSLGDHMSLPMLLGIILIAGSMFGVITLYIWAAIAVFVLAVLPLIVLVTGVLARGPRGRGGTSSPDGRILVCLRPADHDSRGSPVGAAGSFPRALEPRQRADRRHDHDHGTDHGRSGWHRMRAGPAAGGTRHEGDRSLPQGE